MAITAALVKELRERTGSGMMECKKALVEANGDIELAIEEMRKAGLAKADKKADRVAAEELRLIVEARALVQDLADGEALAPNHPDHRLRGHPVGRLLVMRAT